MAIRCSVSVSPAAIMPSLETCPGTAGRMRRTEGAQPAGGRLIVAHLPPAGGVRGLFVGYLPAICRSVRAARGRRCTRCGRSAAALPSGQMDAAVRAAHHAPPPGWAGGLGGGETGRVARRRHAGGDAGHAQHRDDDDDPEQQLAHVQPRCRIISARTGCRCRPGSGKPKPVSVQRSATRPRQPQTWRPSSSTPKVAQDSSVKTVLWSKAGSCR